MNQFLQTLTIFLLTVHISSCGLSQDRQKAKQAVTDYMTAKHADYKLDDFGEFFEQNYPEDIQREIGIVFSVNPNPSKPTITQNGDTLSSTTANSHQWFFNGDTIPEETNQFYTAMQSGFYMVSITDANGCSATSDPLSVTISNIQEIESVYGLKIYPNPNTGVFDLLQTYTVRKGQAITRNINNFDTGTYANSRTFKIESDYPILAFYDYVNDAFNLYLTSMDKEEMIINPISFLTSRKYTPVNSADFGDLVLYGERDRNNFFSKHAGISLGNSVRSKWGSFFVFDHSLFDIPQEYGSDVLYFHPPQEILIQVYDFLASSLSLIVFAIRLLSVINPKHKARMFETNLNY